MLEDHESDIETWYWKHQGQVTLQQFLCSERYLSDTDQHCLKEPFDKPKGEKGSRPKNEL